MSSFLFSLICLLCWGFADLFYKLSSDEKDKNSHLKITVYVGLVMGVTSVIFLLFFKNSVGENLLKGLFYYLPASLSYIISMIIGYVGLRYLELSIISPVQNASGAFSSVFIILYYVISNNKGQLDELFTFNITNVLNLIGTVIIVIGIISLAIVEKKTDDVNLTDKNKKSKYRLGALALLFPLLYCLFDTVGTAADGIILSGDFFCEFSEIDVLILYGLTFLLVGVICFIIVSFKEKKVYNIFKPKELKTKGLASIFEEAGQIFYVYAMAKNPILSAPMIGSYCIVSVLLSRVLLKEKLKLSQYIPVVSVIVGIILLGVSEGISYL